VRIGARLSLAGTDLPPLSLAIALFLSSADNQTLLGNTLPGLPQAYRRLMAEGCGTPVILLSKRHGGRCRRQVKWYRCGVEAGAGWMDVVRQIGRH
jgi:hypothetical protein